MNHWSIVLSVVQLVGRPVYTDGCSSWTVFLGAVTTNVCMVTVSLCNKIIYTSYSYNYKIIRTHNVYNAHNRDKLMNYSGEAGRTDGEWVRAYAETLCMVRGIEGWLAEGTCTGKTKVERVLQNCIEQGTRWDVYRWKGEAQTNFGNTKLKRWHSGADGGDMQADGLGWSKRIKSVLNNAWEKWRTWSTSCMQWLKRERCWRSEWKS